MAEIRIALERESQMELMDSTPTQRSRSILIGASIILSFSLVMFLANRLQDFFTGEDFFVFHWAETYNYLEAVYHWYLANGRIGDAVYWITEYKLLGYQPEIIHLISFVLNGIAVSLAAIALFRAWPKERLRPYQAIVFSILTFFFAHSMNWSLQLASDHVYLAFIFFFASIILVQQWVVSGFKVKWLLLGISVFWLGILTYENISLLFPFAFVLAYPLARFKSPLERRRRIVQALSISAISLTFILVPLQIYSRMESTLGGGFVHPAFTAGGIANVPQQIVASIGYLSGYLINSTEGLVIAGEINHAISALISAVFFVVTPVLTLSTVVNLRNHTEKKTAFVCILLTAIALILGGLFPYSIWGADAAVPHVRFFSLPIYGVSILLVMGFELALGKTLRYIFAGISVFAVILGLREFDAFSRELLHKEYLSIHNYASIVEIVPKVREGTSFLFLDSELGYGPWTGCSLALRMLYATRDLRCGFLSSSNYEAVRNEDGITTPEGGYFWDENWILIGMNEDGTRFIIPQIDTSTNALIDWQITEPLVTDYRRILDGPALQTQMYSHLIKRWVGHAPILE